MLLYTSRVITPFLSQFLETLYHQHTWYGFSQVHSVIQKSFVFVLWGNVNLYTFGKV